MNVHFSEIINSRNDLSHQGLSSWTVHGTTRASSLRDWIEQNTHFNTSVSVGNKGVNDLTQEFYSSKHTDTAIELLERLRQSHSITAGEELLAFKEFQQISIELLKRKLSIQSISQHDGSYGVLKVKVITSLSVPQLVALKDGFSSIKSSNESNMVSIVFVKA